MPGVSLLPKFDELLILADSHNPDVICITESLLSIDIQDSEILIPGYQSLRHDRNRHGDMVVPFSCMFHTDLLSNYSLFIHHLNCLL